MTSRGYEKYAAMTPAPSPETKALLFVCLYV